MTQNDRRAGCDVVRIDKCGNRITVPLVRTVKWVKSNNLKPMLWVVALCSDVDLNGGKVFKKRC